MLSPAPSCTDAYTEIVQIIKGGEPDENGMPLAGRISPFAPTLRDRRCACSCAPLPYDFWEELDRLKPYHRDSDIWLRVLGEEETPPPLPEGAELFDARRVTYSVA